MNDKKTKRLENDNSEIKKDFNCEFILKNLVADVHNELNIEISTDERGLKTPEMFSIWIESRKKLTDKEKIDLIESLKKAYFCSSDEIEGFLCDLENSGKIKIAVLPKIYTSNFLKDLKDVLKDQSSNILINLNEYSC